MKIHSIRFQNINSLRGEHFVDFNSEPLKSAGLFAITGPTGSGKTTLLDVICLALFNRVPRMQGSISRSVIEKTGSILTRNTQEAFAQVDYECASGQFRSRWSISTARTGKLRDYEMEVSNLLDGKLLDLKKSEVPAANADQIGLNYDQFVKSILLAQGEFAKFLQANKSDRSALLEKITGTSIYRSLGMRAFEMNKLHNAELGEVRNRQQVFKDQLLSDEHLKEQQGLQQQFNAKKDVLEKTIKQFEKQLEQRGLFQKTQGEVRSLQQKEAALIEEVKAFEVEEGKRLTAHTSLALQAETLQAWSHIQKELRQTQQEASSLKARLEQNKEGLQQVVLSAQRLVKEPFQETELLSQLTRFQEEVEALMVQRDATRAAYREILAETRQLQKWGVSIDATRFEESVKGFGLALEGTRQQVAALSERLSEEAIQQPSTALVRCTEQTTVAAQAQSLAASITAQRQRIQKLMADSKVLSTTIEALPGLLAQAKEEVEKQQQKRGLLALKLDTQKLRASVESHRAHLVNGKPCPLCGALEHPYAVEIPEAESELETELLQAETALKAGERKLLTYEQEQVSKGRELQQKAKLESEEQQELHKQQELLRSYEKEFSAQQLQHSWEAIRKLLQEEKATLEQLQAAQEKYNALSEAKSAVKQLENLYREGKERAQAIQERYTGKDVVAEVRSIRESWIAAQQVQKGLVEQQQQLETEFAELNKQREQSEQELVPVLEKKGFTSITAALEGRLPEGRVQQLQKRQQQLHEAEQRLQQSIKSQQALLQEQEALLKGGDLERLDQQLAQEREAMQVLLPQLAEVNRQVKNHQENQAEVTTLQKQIAAKEQSGKKWELLNQYIGSSDGKKFNDFAQDLTLSQLVQLANRRLAQLNDRYILDRSRNDEDDSLMVLDVHMGNERRSVKTLSGGETFILSLSLALALSDLASRNVEINSLFIDEGFGTLDPEVLDQTLDTLERLQSEGSKTIGIISHVEALKERITTKVQLIRNGQGYSSLKVVAE